MHQLDITIDVNRRIMKKAEHWEMNSVTNNHVNEHVVDRDKEDQCIMPEVLSWY